MSALSCVSRVIVNAFRFMSLHFNFTFNFLSTLDFPLKCAAGLTFLPELSSGQLQDTTMTHDVRISSICHGMVNSAGST